MFPSILAISLGASLGALLRWSLALMLNTISKSVPIGTLMANLIGGLLIGLAITFFEQHQDLPPQWRLLIITGFLGGLTTFSTFSAEVTKMIQDGDLAIALLTILLHVMGSLCMTFIGIYIFKFFK
jgi:CrcB protein